MNHLLRPFSGPPSGSLFTSGFCFLLSCFRGTLVFASLGSSSWSFRRWFTSWFLGLLPGSASSSLLRLGGGRLLRGGGGRLAGSLALGAHGEPRAQPSARLCAAPRDGGKHTERSRRFRCALPPPHRTSWCCQKGEERGGGGGGGDGGGGGGGGAGRGGEWSSPTI